MTRKWVKQELKKNPLEKFVLRVVEFVKINKNEVAMGVIALVVIALFIGVMIRQRIQSNREAGRIFAAAQADFQSFRYEEAIDKLKTLKREYPGSRIEKMSYYLKGLAYTMQGDDERAAEVFEAALESHSRSAISEHINISVAKVYENLQRYEDSVEQYGLVEQEHYLYPEALLGMAAVYEIKGDKYRAADIYRYIQLNYPHYFWGEISSLRLSALGEPAAEPDNGFFPLREPAGVTPDADPHEEIHDFLPSETPLPSDPGAE